MQSFLEFEALATPERGVPDLADPSVMVTMSDDHLVICTPPHLDLEMTEALVIAAASAVAVGSVVMIDLDPETATNELVARWPVSEVAVAYVTDEGGPVEVLGAGVVRLVTSDSHWTIDMARGRMCRSADAIQPCFIGPGDWTTVQALWIGPSSVTALTADGTYLSTRSAWTARQAYRPPALT